MLRSQGALYNRAGQHIGLDEVTNLKPMEVPKEVIELLMLRQPTMPVRSNKKERRNKKKKNSQLHRERAALKRVTRLGNSDGDNKFKFDPDRPYETGKTLTEFTLFNELAPEVRFMIWKEAFPAPQAVKIRSDAVNYEQRPTLLTVVHRMRYRAKGSYVPSPLLSSSTCSRL
ncbi:uncharacterized protein LY89DRAFT_158369 [Mollisia scopiformis]|uniref:2EXR domain-containing protein n=1 Tax=Mollisia scopiformis TaxID=149040 RepID=A0A194X0G8_MOLSC|nr:uncharacterized protein LY89DRAFT_158369 [Mollisia scopiformis]KUJ13449.1 hypothetical protein LY89DRAFT_158369 [Mollisia scopiformis]